MAARALRRARQASLSKFLNIAEEVNEWFASSQKLHDWMAGFAQQHARGSPSFHTAAVAAQNESAVAFRDVLLFDFVPSSPTSMTKPESRGSLFGDDAILGEEGYYVDDKSANSIVSDKGRVRVLFALDPKYFQQIDHQATLLHEDFCGQFETLLEEFLAEKGVDMEQFQETYRISQQEERRDGKHFHRWMEIIEFEVFFFLMAGCWHPVVGNDGATTTLQVDGRRGVAAVLYKIHAISETAKRSFRRRAEILPLLTMWCPESFHDIHCVLTQNDTISRINHKLEKATLKMLARWRLKFTEKVLGADNVYVDPPRDEDGWSKYLAVYTEKMSDHSFTLFTQSLAQHVENVKDFSVMENVPRRILLDDRRICWQAFNTADVTHAGKVSLYFLERALHRAGAFHSTAQRKKLLLVWQQKLKQEKRNRDLQAFSARNGGAGDGNNGNPTLRAMVLRSPVEQELTTTEVVNILSTANFDEEPSPVHHKDPEDLENSPQRQPMHRNSPHDDDDEVDTVCDDAENLLVTLDQFCEILRSVYGHDQVHLQCEACSHQPSVLTNEQQAALLDLSLAFRGKVSVLIERASNMIV